MDYKEDLKTIIEIYIEENNTNKFTKDELEELIDYCHLNINEYYNIYVSRSIIKDQIKELLEKIYVYIDCKESKISISKRR